MSDTSAITKKCRDCGSVLPYSEFAEYSNHRGLRPMCKPCYRLHDARWKHDRREIDPEFYALELERNKSYRERYSEGYKQHQLKKREKYKSSYFGDLRFRCKQLVASCKRRAERKGMECEITADILYVLIHSQNFKCAVTGTKFELAASKKYHRSPRAPSIDRRDSDRGYTLDNIQIVAAWYNLMKNEWSDEDLREFIHTAYHSIFAQKG